HLHGRPHPYRWPSMRGCTDSTFSMVRQFTQPRFSALVEGGHMHFPRVFKNLLHFQGGSAVVDRIHGHARSIAMGYNRADSHRVSVVESGMGAHVDSTRQAGATAHAR